MFRTVDGVIVGTNPIKSFAILDDGGLPAMLEPVLQVSKFQIPPRTISWTGLPSKLRATDPPPYTKPPSVLRLTGH